MRGPHNLWRLIRTGATFERTGAMRTALEAFDAPPALRVAARVLGWPFQWLGFQGDPSQPPILRALTALGPAYIKFGQLLSTRPDVVGPELAAQLTVLQDKLPPFSDGGGAGGGRARARPAARRGLRRLRAAGRRRLAGAGPPRHAARRPARPWRSRCCAPASSAPSCATSTPSTSPPAWSSSSRPSRGGCGRRR